MRTYWGDLHNHCAISYGSSTLTRALSNARRHLDFCAITGHAFWPDMPMDIKTQDSIIGMHFGGFEKLRHCWPEALREMEAANEPGKFLVFPSYEWHSMEFGDYNCYSKDFNLPLLSGERLPELKDVLQRQGSSFMLLPHHCGYSPGHRGTRWKTFDPEVSPLAEIYSNHGCCESDEAPFEYYHSMGPRAGVSTIRHGLLLGKRFGFYASTDSHDGYPGHYGHGITCVMAPSLTPDAIWEALRNRRTVASTGARMQVDFRLGDTFIGGVHRRGGKACKWKISAEATLPLVRAEMIKGHSGAWRVQPLPLSPVSSEFQPGRHKIKIEAGWGRGAALSFWDCEVEVLHGNLLSAQPCFRHAKHPLSEEEATESLKECGRNQLRWQGNTVPNPAGQMGGTHFNAGGTQSIVLDIQADRNTSVRIRGVGDALEITVPQLVQSSVTRHIGSFGSSALKVHRASHESEWTFQYEEPFHPEGEEGFAYLRLTQADGHTSWTSPIWWE